MASIKRQQQDAGERLGKVPIGPPQAYNGTLLMAQNPTIKAVSFDDLARKYGAVDFQDALADFIARVNYPNVSAAALRTRAEDTLIPFRTVPVFHKMRFVATSGDCDKPETGDSVHTRPEYIDTRGRIVPSRFDTVLVHNEQDRERRNKGKFVHNSVSARDQLTSY
jgi:hypothetical protein